MLYPDCSIGVKALPGRFEFGVLCTWDSGCEDGSREEALRKSQTQSRIEFLLGAILQEVGESGVELSWYPVLGCSPVSFRVRRHVRFMGQPICMDDILPVMKEVCRRQPGVRFSGRYA